MFNLIDIFLDEVWIALQKVLKTRTLLIVSLFLLFLTSLRLFWLYNHYVEHPEANQGILDLRQIDLTKDMTFNLDGEWEFFPNSFITPKQSVKVKGQPLTVPGKWNKYFSEQEFPAYGYGTYRLKIFVPIKDTSREYGIRFPSIRTASKVYVNGQIANVTGNPSDNSTTHEASALPTLTVLKPNQDGELELLIHVSNYDHGGSGGINRSIVFGSLQTINNEFSLSSTMQFLVFVITIIHSLYAFILFALRPKRIELLFFALGLFFFSICIVLSDDRLLLNVLSLDYEWYYKIIKFSYIATTACLLQFIKHMFFAENKYKILDYLSILCMISGLFVVVLPLQYANLTDFNYLLVLLSFCTITILVFKLFISEQPDVLLILLSAISVLSSLVWGTIRGLGIVNYSSFYPYDLIFAIVTFSSYWFKQFFQEAEEKEELYRKLKHEDQLKDQFLANTSHELRNPLHGIINIAESIVIDKNNKLTDTTKGNLELLITISRRMSLMLNDLIDITRIKDQGIVLNKESVNIKAVSSGVFDMLEFMIERKPVKFVIDIPEDFPHVLADKNRLIQILYNLVHNAVKFTHEGVISISADYKGNIARIHVSDTGIGMTKQLQKKIFEPYEQGTSGINEGGLGLGLSISRQLVEMHGGMLTVESTSEKGSNFTFTLQLTDGKVIVEAPPSQPTLVEFDKRQTSTYVDINSFHSVHQLTSRPKILAVDDDVVNLKVLSTILPLTEYDLVTVTSGEEALSYLDRKEWDLIIADVMMPNMSGYELTRIIRGRFILSELPILLLTARSDVQDIVAGFLSGANDYVTKPINSLEFKARVNALTNVKQSISERLRMEAAWLHAQIQPHFLFNTLNTIASLSEIDTDRMTILLDKFGQYLQRSFNPINLQRSVPLEHEIELVKAYLYIKQERFGEKLHVEWKVDPAITIQVPPLSIQTLVENAVRHGVLKQIDGGTISILITNSEEYVEVMIQDKGVGMEENLVREVLTNETKESRGIGLVNTNKRIQQAFGTGLIIQSTIGKGTSVSFHVPKEKNNECRNN
jgi:two-component system, sensor histidine kinase ChiS